MGLILLIVLVLLLAGSMPAWSYARGWGYGPSGLLSVLLVVLLIMLIMGFIPWWGYGPGVVVRP